MDTTSLQLLSTMLSIQSALGYTNVRPRIDSKATVQQQHNYGVEALG